MALHYLYENKTAGYQRSHTHSNHTYKGFFQLKKLALLLQVVLAALLGYTSSSLIVNPLVWPPGQRYTTMNHFYLETLAL